jgi:hypothetical protein
VEARRFALVRRRTMAAKLTLALGGAGLFAVGLPLARLHYAGHAKQRARPLDAPQSFRQAVADDLLRAGILAPANAAPDALTALS